MLFCFLISILRLLVPSVIILNGAHKGQNASWEVYFTLCIATDVLGMILSSCISFHINTVGVWKGTRDENYNMGTSTVYEMLFYPSVESGNSSVWPLSPPWKRGKYFVA